MSKLFSKHRAKTRAKQRAEKHAQRVQDAHSGEGGGPVKIDANDQHLMRQSNKPDNTITLHVDSLSDDGRGVAKHKGKTQFVENALPGEIVHARLLSQKAKFDELSAQEIVKASPDRVTPFCAHYEVCGGCNLQHLAHDEQIRHKQSVLLDGLAKAVNEEVNTVLPALRSKPTHYRSRAKLSVDQKYSKHSLHAGFKAKRSRQIVDVNDCPVLDQRMSALTQIKRLIFERLPVKAIGHIELCLDNVIDESIDASITQSHDKNIDNNCAVLVIRLTRDVDEAVLSALANQAMKDNIHVFVQRPKQKKAQRITDDSESHVLRYSLQARSSEQTRTLTFSFLPSDFTQVNTDINQLMVERAVSLLALSPGDRVLDLFCGLGNFSLPVSLNCKQVVGVEGSQASVDRAKLNANLNNIDNCEFYCADLFADISTRPWYGLYDRILLDPPRAGAYELAKSVGNFGAKRIVYISCNPATLARDSKEIVRQGYRLSEAGVMDMFPHTAHVESVAVFDKI